MVINFTPLRTCLNNVNVYGSATHEYIRSATFEASKQRKETGITTEGGKTDIYKEHSESKSNESTMFFYNEHMSTEDNYGLEADMNFTRVCLQSVI